MGIPTDPAVSDIVTEGLKKGGRVNPTAGDIADATNIHFQEVKSDIYAKARHHYSLVAQVGIGTVTGQSRYNWPLYAEEIRSIQLIDAPTSGSYRDTAQAGGANTITLAAAFSDTSNPSNEIGRMVCLTGGTGAGQFAQIIGYNDATKVVTIEANWTTLSKSASDAWVAPDSTTTYLIENIRYKLWETDKATEFDTQNAPFQQQTPFNCTLVDRQIWLNQAPDRVYFLLLDFWFALDQLDETDTLFTRHMRKFRSVWTQGVAAKVAQRFDDKRAPEIINMYNYMLDMYGAEAASVGQVIYRDF